MLLVMRCSTTRGEYCVCDWRRRECTFFFQAEDGIRDAQESRGLGDVYKRQGLEQIQKLTLAIESVLENFGYQPEKREFRPHLTLSLIHI